MPLDLIAELEAIVDIDMSEEAVTRRLEQVRALYKLVVSLRQVRIEDARPVEPKRWISAACCAS